MAAAFAPRDVALRDERMVRVRDLRPTDEDEVLQAFERLSPDARYFRFMTAKTSLDVGRMRALLASFPEHGMALAATSPAADGIDIVGTGSFVVEGRACEFAVAVADAWTGAGLGRFLLLTLIEAARERGLEEMTGYVLAQNEAMLGLAARLGFAVAVEDDFTLRVCRLRL